MKRQLCRESINFMIFLVFTLALLVGCDRNQKSQIESYFGLAYSSEAIMVYHQEAWGFRGEGDLLQIHELPKGTEWINMQACHSKGLIWGFFETVGFTALLIAEHVDLEQALCSKTLEEENSVRVFVSQGHRLYYYQLAR